MVTSYLLLALSAATLVVGLFVLLRLKTVLYLLQQPVVKKMSPQLRLKPVKLDEVLNRGGREGGRPEGGDRGPRPERREGRGEGRREDRGPRSEGRGQRGEGRPEGGRPERGERREDRPRRDGERGDRGPRPERAEGDRPRREDRPERAEGDRGPREGREGGRGREDRPRREFSETRDFAPAPESASTESAPLSPRRPLFADNAEPRSEIAPVRENPASETFVGSSSDDLQHGRRLQLKKKPKFDFDEDATEA